MKKISMRKSETVRLTSAAQALYLPGCNIEQPVYA